MLKSIHYESASPDVQKNIMDARAKEWSKFLEFAAVVEISKEDAERLIAEGHQCIPSKWVDVDKNQFMKGRTDQEYVPKFKSRLVSCVFAVGRRSRVHNCTVRTSHPHISKVVLSTEFSL